jgi:hypothetical protein
MKERVKVVARNKTGEVLKGFVNKDDLSRINNNEPIYLDFVNPSNTVGTYISLDQLEGLFIVKTFQGKKAGPLKRIFFDTKRVIRDNLSLISAAAIVGLLTLVGFIAFL